MTQREIDLVKALDEYNIPNVLDLIRTISGPDEASVRRLADGVIASGEWSINDVHRVAEAVLSYVYPVDVAGAPAFKVSRAKKEPKDDVEVTTEKLKRRR